MPGPNQTPEYYDNQFLSARNTFYWSKLAMARHPGDYTKADLIHWLHNFDYHLTVRLMADGRVVTAGASAVNDL